MSENMAREPTKKRESSPSSDNRPSPRSSGAAQRIGRVLSIAPRDDCWEAEFVILEREERRRKADKVVRKGVIKIPASSFHEMLHYLDNRLAEEVKCQT